LISFFTSPFFGLSVSIWLSLMDGEQFLLNTNPPAKFNFGICPYDTTLSAPPAPADAVRPTTRLNRIRTAFDVHQINLTSMDAVSGPFLSLRLSHECTSTCSLEFGTVF